MLHMSNRKRLSRFETRSIQARRVPQRENADLSVYGGKNGFIVNPIREGQKQIKNQSSNYEILS